MPQQMRAPPIVQSWSDVHVLGHVAWQTPPQQSGEFAVPLQSESEVHDLGHAVAWRQIAPFPMLGSRPPAVVQQISPEAVSQSVFDEHVVGQLLAAVQNGVE